MEVTSTNFEVIYSEFAHHLGECEFYTIDLEMTGIKSKESWGDLLDEKYVKMKNAALLYNPIQYGISLFKRVHSDQCLFEVKTYNFYVYPHESMNSTNITLEHGAIAFNKTYHMNFQKWIYEGVHYLDKESYTKLKEKFDRNHEKENSGSEEELTLNRQGDVDFFKTTLERIDTIAMKAGESSCRTEVPGANGFMRKYIYEYVKKNRSDLACCTETRKVNDREERILVLYRFSSNEEKAKFDQQIKEKKLSALEAKQGFRRIFKLMAKSKKPLIGHNLLYDLLFTFGHFHFLPAKLAEFKEMLHRKFPIIYDTRNIMRYNRLPNKDVINDQNLSSIYESLLNIQKDKIGSIPLTSVFKQVKTFDYDPNDVSKCHEAGFDAYITGVAFQLFRELLKPEDVERLKNRINVYKSPMILYPGGQDHLRHKAVFFVEMLTDSVYEVLDRFSPLGPYAVQVRKEERNTGFLELISDEKHEEFENILNGCNLFKKILPWEKYCSWRNLDKVSNAKPFKPNKYVERESSQGDNIFPQNNSGRLEPIQAEPIVEDGECSCEVRTIFFLTCDPESTTPRIFPHKHKANKVLKE